MPAEKQIDNYVDKIDEENTIYVEKELEYAEKCHNLEEQLGCPLEVYVKATIDGIKVDGSTFKIKVRKDKDGYYFALSNGSCFPFYLKAYKKTWRLEEDKSE